MSEWVWVVQVEDYDNESVIVVATSLSAAIEALKAEYGAEYAVDWSSAKPVVFAEDPENETPSWYTIAARFKARPGFSTDHATTWSIQRHVLVNAESPAQPEG